MAEELIDDRTLNEQMDESIRATLRDIQGRAPAEEEPAPEPAAEPAQEPEPQAAERPRDPEGKFVKGEAKRHRPAQTSAAQAEPTTPPAAKAAPEPAAAEPGAQAEPELKFGNVTVDLARPPSSWKPAAKAAWAALPEDVRKEIYRRETDFSNSVLNGPLKESADFGKAVRQAVEPYRGLIEAEGGDYTRAIADTMKTAALFRTGSPQAKLNAIFQIDQQFCQGALNQHFLRRVEEEVARRTGGQPQAGQPGAQPAVVHDPRLDALQTQFQTITQALQAQEQERARAAEAASNGAVEQFFAAKNEKGEPLYPFVDNVLDDMSTRVAILRRSNPQMSHADALKEAYEAAVWANPETRAVLIAAQTAAAAQPAQALRKVESARAASAATMPRRGALPGASPALSLEDDIRETGRKLGMF